MIKLRNRIPLEEDVQRSLQAGINSHLSKPVDPDLLFRTLGELIYEAEAGLQTCETCS